MSCSLNNNHQTSPLGNGRFKTKGYQLLWRSKKTSRLTLIFCGFCLYWFFRKISFKLMPTLALLKNKFKLLTFFMIPHVLRQSTLRNNLLRFPVLQRKVLTTFLRRIPFILDILFHCIMFI